MIKGLTRFFWPGLLSLLIASCGGGENGNAGNGGGFTKTADTLRISIQADDLSMPANLNGEAPSRILPFTTSVMVRVQRTDGSVVPNGTEVQLALDGVRHGAITKLDDPKTEDVNEFFVLTGTNFTETASGQAQFFFTSDPIPGTATLVASVTDPVSGKTESARLQITVIAPERPVSSLSFTGPFVNAVLGGLSRFGTPPLQNGAYSRVISVVATDASGNPVAPGTPINFFLIDAPISGYPASGAGSFFIAGDTGNPLESDFLFTAAKGEFLSKGVRPFDRLVLDGTKTILPDNRDLTGVRTVEAVLNQNELYIQRQGQPFAQNADNAATVPYVIGRAQHATILSPSFTDVTGTADTLLTYPAFRLGQTAILVACNADNTVCTVLNTCSAKGGNCSSVYLGVSDGTDRVLTTSHRELAANSTTDVRLCLKDANLAPLPATPINMAVGAHGAATVSVNEVAGGGVLLTGGDGCLSAKIAVSGQIPGTDPILLTVTADGVAEPVEITIKSPGAGNLQAALLCDLDGYDSAEPTDLTCTVSLRLTDDGGVPIPDVVIEHSFEGFVKNVTYDPSFGAFGITDPEGQVIATVLFGAGASSTITFKAPGGAEYELKADLSATDPPT